MSKNPWDTKEFRELEKQWNEKLEKSGFEDIEPEGDRKFNTFHKQIFEANPRISIYNTQCWRYLHSGKIKNKLDYFIFEKHCEGHSCREIAPMLKAMKLRELHYTNVNRRIFAILEEAGIEPLDTKY